MPKESFMQIMAAFSNWQALRGLAPRTIERRRWTLHRWRTQLDPRSPWEATREDIEAFLGALPVAQTRYSLRADLHQFYRWAIQAGHTEVDPTTFVDPPRLPRRAPTPVAAIDVRRAIDTAEGRIRTMIMLAAMAGLRVSEIANLHREDVADGVIVVRHGKGGKDRTIPLAPELAADLAGYPPGRLFTCAGPYVSDLIRRHLRRIGITARPHDLRHSFATQLARLSAGNVVLVQQLLGHESLVATQRYMGWSAPGAEVVAALYAA